MSDWQLARSLAGLLRNRACESPQRPDRHDDHGRDGHQPPNGQSQAHPHDGKFTLFVSGSDPVRPGASDVFTLLPAGCEYRRLGRHDLRERVSAG